ncbi:hypothetical protein CHS0354_015535 [Potamilus streckersoni]|uniref:Uncharacterized protein n=1 Tax=Potamilus streckersoni TaxID=2493646 RepID=A0AAE0T621_9BIVA|nr:hypothetical protein CHS0354_015535 [Potamilus streckersoni]
MTAAPVRMRRQTSSTGSSSGGGGSGGGASPPSFDPNSVNKPQTNLLDPSQSKLGSSGGGGSGFNPDTFNTMNFNFFNPRAQSGGGGGGGGGSAPQFDGTKVNQLQTNMLDPSQSKLGASGGGAGGFNPDQFNSVPFNFFNPQNQLG